MYDTLQFLDDSGTTTAHRSLRLRKVDSSPIFFCENVVEAHVLPKRVYERSPHWKIKNGRTRIKKATILTGARAHLECGNSSLAHRLGTKCEANFGATRFIGP
jgi:hypothetical protein